MKSFIKYVVSISVLIFVLNLEITNAMWVKMSDTELVEQSDVIVTAELIGQTQVMINQARYVIGALKVEEVLKGDKNQVIILLALPPTEGPRKSDDIFYKKGEKGLWFLRERKEKGDAGIYLADHPCRFIPMKHSVNRIEEIRKIIND